MATLRALDSLADDVLGDVDRLRLPRPSWQRKAACRGMAGTGIFFRTEDEDAAKVICGRCAVRSECLAYALDHSPLDGVWGGTTAQERRAWRKASA